MQLFLYLILFIAVLILFRMIFRTTIYRFRYEENGLKINGILVKHPFSEITFIPFEERCDFSIQQINKDTSINAED